MTFSRSASSLVSQVGPCGPAEEPERMAGMLAIARVKLAAHHLSPGRTKHTLSDSKGIRPFPPFVELVITHDPGQEGYYLMHHAADGTGTDTWHERLEDAIDQAEWEFEVKPEEWTPINEPYTG
jgi:hypothetical protein